jgi:hypothetical protein
MSHRWRTAPLVTSDVPAIQSALDAPRAQQLIATGTWELRRRGTTWEVVGPGASRTLATTQRLEPPGSMIASASGTDPVPGTLLSGERYDYWAALLDPDSDSAFGVLSAVFSGTPGAGGTLRIMAGVVGAPGRLALWRRRGPSGDPSAYIVVPTDGNAVHCYDTGAHLNKRPWRTSGIPRLPADSSTRDGLRLGGATGRAALWVSGERRLATDSLMGSTAGFAMRHLGTIGSSTTPATSQDVGDAFGTVPPPTAGVMVTANLFLVSGASTPRFTVLVYDGVAWRRLTPAAL